MKQTAIHWPLSPVDVKFNVVGDVASINLVQIYYQGPTVTDANLAASVNMKSSQTSYDTTIQLPPGGAFAINFCPRTEKNGVLDDKIDGESWETFCVTYPFTTKANADSGGGIQTPTPNIIVRTSPKTLKSPNSITWSWTSAVNYDFFQVRYDPPPSANENETKLDGGGNGSFTIPATPKVSYTVKVEGCLKNFFGLFNSICSSWAVGSVTAQDNLTSLKQFLIESGVNPNNGIKSIQPPITSLRSAMGLS